MHLSFFTFHLIKLVYEQDIRRWRYVRTLHDSLPNNPNLLVVRDLPTSTTARMRDLRVLSMRHA